MTKNKIAVANEQVYIISIETAKEGARTLDWAQGLAVD